MNSCCRILVVVFRGTLIGLCPLTKARNIEIRTARLSTTARPVCFLHGVENLLRYMYLAEATRLEVET